MRKQSSEPSATDGRPRDAWASISPVKAGLLAFTITVCLYSAAPIHAETAALGPYRGGEIARAGTRTAWQLQLPLRFTDRIETWGLVDGLLYARFEDGTVQAVRADTGRAAWVRSIVQPMSMLHGPTGAHMDDGVRAVVFTLIDEVRILERDTGQPIETRTTRRPNVTAALVAENRLLLSQSGRRFLCQRLDDDLELWAKSMPGLLEVPPILIPVRHGPWVACADSQGTLLVVDLQGTNRFVYELDSPPVGGLAADAHAVYVATQDRRLRAISLATGELLWSMRLAGLPNEAPVVTGDALYQATLDAGLYRVTLPEPELLPEPEDDVSSLTPSEAVARRPTARPRPDVLAGLLAMREPTHWRAPEVRRFLAEWPRRIVVQRHDGLVALMYKDDARPRTDALLDPCTGFEGLSNAVNDAVLLTAPDGRVRCWRPVGAPPLTLEDFAPPAVPPQEDPGAETP